MTDHARAAKATVRCYRFWDCVFRQAGVLDYTEGFYDGDPALGYERAQQRQIRHLLDQVGCRKGSRILDIGCGNGTLLDEVRRRDAAGVGVTISPEQVRFCRGRGLDVHLLNYRNISAAWNGRFDAVVANGSIEHFVQPADALAGRGDAIYREFFAIARRMLSPQSNSRRLINTTIHFGNVFVKPEDASKSPWAFPWNSERFHYAWLARGFGGYYPTPGQLEACARPHFRLVSERDATHDYYLTSEEWFSRGKRSLLSLRQWGRLTSCGLRHPVHAARMLFLLLATQSWNWQFRGENPPMKHLWQTWEADAAVS